MQRLRAAILGFGILNAALYSGLLPLWEGFDEPAHYGYVESLWQTGRLPILGHTTFPRDVLASFRFAPGSYLMHRWRPETMTYEEWYGLPQPRRAELRASLDAIRPDPRAGAETNYEAHHPPLAYLPLAAIDRVITAYPITVRVLALRLFAATSSVILLFFGAIKLCRELHMAEGFTNALLCTVFCAQMFYASAAHVANDWLAIPLAVWCFAAIAAYVNKPSERKCVSAGAWLAAGLLTKAYFLAIAAWFAGIAVVMIWRRGVRPRPVLLGFFMMVAIAAPWYLRNVAVYGNVSGTYEAFSGVGLKQAVAAIPHVDWPAAAAALARASLWMGNNSGTSFSRATLYLMLILLALGVAAWAARSNLISRAEKAVAAGVGVYLLAIAYAVCSTFACSACSYREASPWYTQVLLVPVLALAFLGMSRWRSAGTIAACITLLLWGWVFIASWVVKLFPLYSGAGAAPMHVRDIWDWYMHRAAGKAGAFSLTALAPAHILYAGLAISVGWTIALAAAVIGGLRNSEGEVR